MQTIKKYIKKFLLDHNLKLTRVNNMRERNLFFQLQKKYADYTMIPAKTFISNLELVHHYVPEELDGDVVECGVWRGGMIAGIAEYLKGNRKYFLFDSFEGLPPAKEIDGASAIAYQQDIHGEYYHNNCTAPKEIAEEAMNKTGCQYAIYKGWFDQTIPVFSASQKIALLRLDADWYDSTMVCLTHLYPKLVYNGLLLIDDYFAWDGCSRAVHDYLSQIQSVSRIRTLGSICYIQKKDPVTH